MAKPEREFFPATEIEWTPALGGKVPGMYERILAVDPETGVVTRILRLDPGTSTSAAGVQVHSYWEEVYILEGSLHDLTLDQTFGQGSYACRPPEMRHGPWSAPDGCLAFEVRYVVGGGASAEPTDAPKREPEGP
jgi:hypothetical protein